MFLYITFFGGSPGAEKMLSFSMPNRRLSTLLCPRHSHYWFHNSLCQIEYISECGIKIASVNDKIVTVNNFFKLFFFFSDTFLFCHTGTQKLFSYRICPLFTMFCVHSLRCVCTQISDRVITICKQKKDFRISKLKACFCLWWL